jgi:hypothetical protein
LSSEAHILWDRTKHPLKDAPEVVGDRDMGIGRVEATLRNLGGREGR